MIVPLAPENLPQEGAQRGGHIPTAVSIPWGTAVNAEDGTFKSTEELKEIYGGKGITSNKEVIAYCRIGERSAHTWFVLKERLQSRGLHLELLQVARWARNAGNGTEISVPQVRTVELPT